MESRPDGRPSGRPPMGKRPWDPMEKGGIVRRAFDEIAQGELAVADEIIATGFVRHDLGGTFPEVTGPEGVKRLIAGLRAAFPDIKTTVEDVISGGAGAAGGFTAPATREGGC